MNIVTATFSAGCTQIDADRKLWQYDQGQILQLVGLELPDTYQVEFSNSRDKGSAKAQIGGPDGVSIPDEYLTTGKPVYAFLVGHTAEEDRETEKLVVIYVNARSQPTDEPITPEQQSIVDQLIAALTAGVAKAEDAAAQAEAAISYMPKIVDGTWWVYDAETETWADTGIQAEGQDGVGISGAVLNADYTLTLTFTDGTSYTTPSIRGPKGEDAPDDYILVQPTEPTSETNALWINSAAGERVQLPTMADHQALAEAVADNTEAIGDLSDELADQKSAIDGITETYTPHNLYDYTKNEANKYLNPNGVMEDYNGRYVTDYIPAVPGKYIVCSYIASNNTVTRTNYSAICCFDENKNVVSGGNYNKSSFLVPNGVAFVRITVSGTMNVETAMVENSNDTNPTTFEFFRAPTNFLSRSTIIYPTKMGFMSAKSALSAGERIDLPYHNVKNENVIAFTANITSFSSLKIGKSNDAIITVDSTNIILHNDQGGFTEAHGLTIENNLQILITNKTSINADTIRVTSNGISHTLTGIHRFIMDEGNPFVESVDSTLTDAVLSWSSRNINKPIWLFGDSYFSWYPSRWAYYLAEDGFTESCMLNGFAGETVKDGMLALRSLLNVKTPDYVVWCLGMNNADGGSAVSPSWKIAYDELVGLANSYGFELILATIPNTPTVNNTFKNDIVKNSGYRYIDFSNAVNVPNSNTWYSGMLANDNVHPTATGAKSLYGQVLADFPEITSV